MIDFAALAARLLSNARSLLAEWYPQGRLHGHEFKIGDIHGSEGDSLSINVNTGQWADFAADLRGGDLISLYAHREGLSQADAARKLDGDYFGGSGGPPRALAPVAPPEEKREKWTPILPVPEDAPKPIDDYYRPGAKDAKGNKTWHKLPFIARWPYHDIEGRLLGYAVRFEWFESDGSKHKDIIPQVYCAREDGKRQWRWRAFPEPRPLYGLAALRSRPDAPIIVVEGEKKVDALATLCPQYIGIAWPGGAASWRKADWKPIHGRTILCWPDADKQVITSARQAEEHKLAIGERIPRDRQPGMRAMWEIGHLLLKHCPTVKVIIPDDETLPDGWDAADAVRDGWDWQRFKEWALPRVVNLTEGGSHASAQQRSTGGRDRGGSEQASGSDAQAGAAAEAHDAAAAQAMAGAAQPQQDDPAHEASGHHHDRRPEQRASQADRGAQARSGSDAARPGGREGRDATPGASSRTDASVPAGSRPQERSSGVRTQALAEKPPAQGQIGSWLSWGVERNGNGLPIVNLNNAVIILERDPELRGLVWFDEFLGRLMTGEPAREWSDADDISLTLYMQRAIGISKMGRETVSQAVIAMAMRDRRNCVKTYMESIEWDGVERISAFMATAFHCDDTPYVRAASRNFWISLIARVYAPGCKVDNMIVLEGSQGLMKSTALSALADPWFAEQHESATNPKAFAEVLQGKLLTEISEMDAFDRAEVKRVKGTVTCQVDRYRASYARHAADHPRQGVMAGTTNKDDWNRDETGARRFWPIRCKGMADVDYVRQNRAQCFAEALAAYRAGEPWWKMPDAETTAEQRKRYDADPWIEPISFWLQGRESATVMEIATTCLRIETKDIDRTRQMRIAGVLRALQWVNEGNRKRSGKVVKVWTPPGDSYPAGSDQRAKEPDEAEDATQRSLPQEDLPYQ